MTVTSELLVLCEGQADCHFYGALAAAMRPDTPSSPEVRFLDGGGKYALPKLIGGFRQHGEDVRVIVDFDVLSTETPLSDIVEALSGNWPVYQALWREVQHGVRAQHRVQGEDVTERGVQPGRRKAQGRREDKTRRQVKQVWAGSSPWVRAKRCGRRMVPEDLKDSYRELAASLAAAGLFLVEVGELEGFVPWVGHHGSRWAGQVLKRYDAASAPELEEARRFVRHVLSSQVEVGKELATL
jgi:hypothetical protein